MLFEVSPSIGDLNKIFLIDLEDCVSLRSLPRSIYKLKSLKSLILSGCLMIEKLEEGFEDMKSLVSLDVPSSSSHELSSFYNQLPMLQSLPVECSSELQLSQDAAIILDTVYDTNYKELEPAATTSQDQNSPSSLF
ncbi:hypothetical protein OROHE_006806 [Orobanche hederae]